MRQRVEFFLIKRFTPTKSFRFSRKCRRPRSQNVNIGFTILRRSGSGARPRAKSGHGSPGTQGLRPIRTPRSRNTISAMQRQLHRTESKVAYIYLGWIIQRSRKPGLLGFSCLRITTINFSKLTFRVHTGWSDRFWWTADGSALYFTQHDGRGHSAELWELRSGDLKPQLVYRADVGEYLSSFSSDNAGKVFACVRENNSTPPQIAVIDAVTKPVRPIVDLNPGVFHATEKGVRSAWTEKILTAKTGFAYLVKPLDFMAGHEVSADRDHLYRSGDYFLQGASGDENPIQVYAAHAAAPVLCVDVGWTRIRVTGDFDETLLNWASPTASIAQAVRRLAQEGIIDLARVGIAGFSHGEEIAGYAVIHSDLFHAAVGAQNYDPFFYFLGSDEWHDIFEQWGLSG